jgi:branched-chain amino acid transport system substrate-binding protein
LEENHVRSRKLTALIAVATAGALALSACKSSGGDSDTAPTTGGTTSSGGAATGKKLIISTDLPLQGASADQSKSTNDLINLYLAQVGHKAGAYTVELKTYDDSTAAKGAWDDATCAANAQAHVAEKTEVAVMGTFNSGCAKIEVPVLNQAPDGPLLMVSHANTNPGLTKTWDPGEPEKYFPSGKRSYARVVTTDDYQGAAGAIYAKEKLGVSKVYILNDNQTYGIGVAKAFETEAKKIGLTVLGNDAWDAKASSYTSLFQKIKATSPDMVYLGGIYDNNGGVLVKDKVAVLGDNSTVKLMAPDGFTGYTDLQKLAQGEGLYLTFAGLTTGELVKAGGPPADLIAAYKAKYGAEPVGSYPLYGVAAVQVILAAIAKSDGTRASVNSAVFSGDGISIPMDQSVTGKAIDISPETGDTSAIDITVEQLKGGVEEFVAAQAVS